MQRLLPLTSADPAHPLFFEHVLSDYDRQGLSPELRVVYCSANTRKATAALEAADLKTYEQSLAVGISMLERIEDHDIKCELYLKLVLFYLQQSVRDRVQEARLLLSHTCGVHKKYTETFHAPDSGMDFLDSGRPAAFVEQLHLFAQQAWPKLPQESK